MLSFPFFCIIEGDDNFAPVTFFFSFYCSVTKKAMTAMLLSPFFSFLFLLELRSRWHQTEEEKKNRKRQQLLFFSFFISA